MTTTTMTMMTSPVLDDDDDTFQRKFACPLCSLVTRDTVGLFQHLITSYSVVINSRMWTS